MTAIWWAMWAMQVAGLVLLFVWERKLSKAWAQLAQHQQTLWDHELRRLLPELRAVSTEPVQWLSFRPQPGDPS
jgi:hypothetical protein